MSKELIERLRADAESTDDIGLCADAADRIEELECEIERKMSAAAFILKERDALLADNERLRDALQARCYWFETQAKVVSKGGPSSWELMLLRDERDACDEALATTPAQSLAALREQIRAEAFAEVADKVEALRDRLNAWINMKEPE